MLNKFLLGICLISIIIVQSCSTEDSSSLNREVETVAIAVNQDLQNFNLLTSFRNQFEDKLIPSFVEKKWLDTSLMDGTPMIQSVDFKSGYLCTDGVTRKGKCYIEYFNQLGIQTGLFSIYATENDSFAVASQWGWSYFSGTLTISNKEILKDSVFSNWKMLNDHLTIPYLSKFIGKSIRNPAKVLTISVNDGYQFDGAVTLTNSKFGAIKSQCTSLKKYANSNCLFAEGIISFTENYSDITIDFNPLKDFRVDGVAKAKQKSKEWFFDFQ